MNANKGNIQKTNSNASPSVMPIILAIIGLCIVFYVILRWIQYRRTECPAGMKKVNFFLFLIGYPLCILPGDEEKTSLAFLRGFQPIPLPASKMPLQEIRTLTTIPNVAASYVIGDPAPKGSQVSGKITPQNVTDIVPAPSKLGKNEVFHISNQDFTYEQARCKCSSYGAKLATYDQLVDAYNNGADWCSYGWTEGQRAYYPTQKCSWDKLQVGPQEMRGACGEPGINGGFFPDGNMKFGATCYGVKPKGKVAKLKPVTSCQLGVCERPENADVSVRKQTDVIAPFDKERWNSS